MAKTLLWENSGTSATNITLTESYENFDYLEFELIKTTSPNCTPPNAYISVSDLMNNTTNIFQMYAGSTNYISFNKPTSEPKTTFTYVSRSNLIVKKVYGIKY